MNNWSAKDPDITQEFAMDWAMNLDPGETIVSAQWLLQSGLTLVSQRISGTQAIAEVSGGMDGQLYTVTCRMVGSLSPIPRDYSQRLRVKSH